MRIAIAALLSTMAFETSAAPGKRIVRWAHAESSKRIYKGRCPVQLIFSGTISVARPGQFTYEWKRSDGVSRPARTLRASKAGESWHVSEVWELTGSTQGWAQLWIPSEQHGSQLARFRVQCK